MKVLEEVGLVSIPDSELLQIFKDGDRRAYEQIYKRYWGILYVYARKILSDEDDAQDIVQEVFTNLWYKGSELTISTSLSSYLYTSVRYKFFDLLDHRKLRTNYKEYLQQFIEDGEYITDNHLREREFAAVIEKEVARLPAKMREIFELSRNIR
ncbi:RNA polymerase subunit sigma-70 [Solitalea longa]|uniref:RNA polymerase subunit sigma-70 n=1 Tax=Solitalea longa TaxID=2079460 RepID=A0A2S5A5S3_9SPHI|nr:sigma-70 family RNA polymerase sigma factor [Solitalea longa]POY37876.1 RNA polymerase subunit sigma-70 [Solitalea longa]